MNRVFFLLLWSLLGASAFSLNIEKSESKFFPKELGEKMTLFKSFETFWWGFVITESDAREKSLALAHETCLQLKSSSLFQRVECEQTPGTYSALISDWARDLPLREPPPENLKQKFLAALGKASLPLPADIFSVLRTDPLESYNELIRIFKSRLSLPFERVQGVFFDEKTFRGIIPVQPKFPTSESEKLIPLQKALNEKLKDGRIVMMGPHASTIENKEQISKDLNLVSWGGMAVLLSFIVMFGMIRQLQLSWLLFPVLLGAGLAALTIDFIFGSIHGLTLCFGPGIIGLTIDYGLQAAFHPRSTQVWKSNFSGFLTTFICLLVISLTKIPLLKELMYFSAFGFLYIFSILYFSRNFLGKFVKGTEFKIPVKQNRRALIASLLLVVGLVYAVFKLKPALEFNQFDFQSPNTKEFSRWLYPKVVKQPPLFQISHGLDKAIEESHQLLDFARKQNIPLETIGIYLPLKDKMLASLEAWKKMQCGPQNISSQLTRQEQILFAPGIEKWSCEKLSAGIQLQKAPAYLRSLRSQDNYLTLWFPNSAEEVSLVKKQFPEATSLKELTTSFSTILGSEVAWMIPLSLFFIFTYLFIYYRNVYLALCGFVPFLVGCGAIAWAGILFSFPFSFMTFIAIIMVLGMSVDYSVFSIDALLFLKEEKEIHRTATGLLFSALTTLLGFLPLIFCKHQVLFQLGMALTLGILGTLVGSYITLPGMIGLRRKP